MMITLDILAQRYGLLPSEALKRASTLDLVVLDVGAKWNNKQYNKEEPTVPELTQEQMLEKIEKARAIQREKNKR